MKGKSWKFWTWGFGALLGIAIVAIVAVTGWAFVKPKVEEAIDKAKGEPAPK